MAPPLIVRLLIDTVEYFKGIEGAVSSNTRLNASVAKVNAELLGLGETASVSADQTVAASLRASAALEKQALGLRALSVSSVADAQTRARAAILAEQAEARHAASFGLTAAATRKFSNEAKTAERDIGKLARGAIAGSGAAEKLGRSLAFASTSFIAVAGGATVIAESIKAAENLAAAQRRVDQQLKTGGKTWAEFGGRISEVNDRLRHVAGFTDTELLQAFSLLFRASNNVGTSLRFLGVAADTARALNKPLAATSTALSKALGGNLTALRRLGVSIPKTLQGMDALNFVQAKFAGQAAQGTTASERFRAEIEHTGAVIGTVLLPTFTRLIGELGDWLHRMNESGRLQRDVTELVHLLGVGFHALEDVVHAVDKVTGSFANTLKLVVGLRIGLWLAGAVRGLDLLVGRWLAVEGAATAAARAQTRALEVSAAAGGVGAIGAAETVAGAGGVGIAAALAQRRATRQAATEVAALKTRIDPLTGQESAIAAVGGAAAASTSKVALLSKALGGLNALVIAPIAIPIVLNIEKRLREKVTQGLDSVFGRGQTSDVLRDLLVPHSVKDFLGVSAFNDIFRYKSPAEKAAAAVADFVQKKIIARLQQRNFNAPAAFRPAGPLGRAVTGADTTSSPERPFGAARPITVFKHYQATITQQLAQARAGLTKSTADDVRVARAIVARVKKLIDHGHLAGQSLVEALQAEAEALGTIRDAAAARKERVKAAQAAALQALIDPLKLEVQLARAQASGQSGLPALKALLASAKKALSLATSRHNLQGQKDALDQIINIQQQIKDASQQATVQFQVPARLALALSRDQALGRDTTKDLLAVKRAILKFIRNHHKNTQALTDAYGQLGDINAQLKQSSVQFQVPAKLALRLARDQALGRDTTKDLLAIRAAILKFIRTHRKNTQAVTDAYNQLADVNSQLGDKTASYFKQLNTAALTAGLDLSAEARAALRARLSQIGPGGTVPGTGVGAGGFVIDPNTDRPIHLHTEVKLDGKTVAKSTTKHQQRRRRHNPGSRRGPNAGLAY